MRTSLILCVLLIWTVSGVAQTNAIIGRVTDAKTLEPLQDVRVYWKSKKEDLVRTNKFGVFQIPQITDKEVLVFEYAGKKTKEENILAASFNELNITLEEKGVTAVTASRWEQSIHETPASVVVISRDEIESHGYLTVQEVLESVPGVFTVDHRSESDVTIGVRGFWAPFNRNVMIQVNGVSMLSERQNDFPLNKINVPVEAIDRVEIVRGPLSVIYGTGAFFGVINIVTNEAQPGNAGQVTLSGGTQNSRNAFVRYAINQDGLRLSFNASTIQRDGFDEQWNDFTTEEAFRSDLVNIPVGATRRSIGVYQGLVVNPERYSKNHESLNLSVGYNGFTGDFNYAVSDFGFSFLHPGPGNRNGYRSSTLNTQFGYRGSSRGGDFDYQLKLAFMNSVVDGDYHYFDPTVSPSGQDRVRSLRMEANFRKVFLDSREGNNLDLDIIGGLWYNQNLINHSRYDAPEFELVNWFVGLAEGTSLDTRAGYLQLNLKKGNLQVVAGGRLEQQANYRIDNNFNIDVEGETATFLSDEVETDNINFIPRLALIYSLGNENKLQQFFKILYGRAIRQATAVDNAQDVLFARNGLNVGSNVLPYLRPEEIETFEIGYTLVSKPLDLEINANFFVNNLDNLVTREASLVNNNFVTRSTNNGAQSTTGVELIVKKQFNIQTAKGLSLFIKTALDLTYQETSDANFENVFTDNSSFEIPDSPLFAPSFSPTLLGGLKITGDYRKLGFGTQLNYVGRMRSQVAEFRDSRGVGSFGFIGEDTSDYVRLGINLRVRNLRFFKEEQGGMFINLRGSNVLDRRYRYPAYTQNPWADLGILGRGRQLLVTVGYKF